MTKNFGRHIDHLVYCVHDLDSTLIRFKEMYGIDLVIGGKHLNHGTQNALVNLGDGCYLEILAVDKNNTVDSSKVWMGLNHLTDEKMTRWALKSNDIQKEIDFVNAYDTDLGKVQAGKREKTDGSMLEWKMTVPLSYPEVELYPFFVDWSSSDAHPTDTLPEEGNLLSLDFFHPEPQQMESHFSALGLNIKVSKHEFVKITASIEGPKGVFQL